MKMEEQVVSIYSAAPQPGRDSWVRGYENSDLLRYEAELLDFVRQNHGDVLSAIASSGKLESDVEEKLIAALDAAIARRTAGEWMERWNPLGLAAAPVANLEDLANDPQAWENDYFVETYCEEVQRDVKVRGLPVGLSKTPGSVRTLGPELGQHTEEILTELLGYTWEQVVELKEQGAIL